MTNKADSHVSIEVGGSGCEVGAWRMLVADWASTFWPNRSDLAS